ncbi:L-alanine-DL-glutamate epimerase [Paenibacillus polysaccharolyticus]|uniref:L-alanine-DL-glutamate epimerase n=1 Tax=Paenibacillus polysaccharolyticus TaxID=582692 RepID=A0A1G5E480_9BACL|nr:enolase C-terminal domain-like protein [Paenibacillus polysaccharolyticus]SCY21318.1 L-alanine-DL-glutamate epimerase [Paenibacillus polysaccharolyticus]
MKLTHKNYILQLGEPFISNKGIISMVEQLIIQVHWETYSGIGTAIYANEYGFTKENTSEFMDFARDILLEYSPYEFEKVTKKLWGIFPNCASAISAVDMAIHDLIGKVTGLPLYKLWGLENLPLPMSSISLGSLPRTDLVEKAKGLLDWPILKIKLKKDSDLKCIEDLRSIYNGRIWVDGNCSWSPDETLRVCDYMSKYSIELLEQPIANGNVHSLHYIHKRSPIPIIADEDCVNPSDVLKLQESVSGVNIKLCKCGGLSRAVEMIRLARSLNLKVMLGCKTESIVGISAMGQLAGLADYLDLDGHLDLVNDPFQGIELHEGLVTLPSYPGIGITV